MVGVRGTLLPLLMVKGSIKCLDSMSVEDFQAFIPFMTQCAAQDDPKWSVSKPEWWLDSVEFAFPMIKPPALSWEKFRRMLRSLVFRCYCFYQEKNILMVCYNLSSISHLIRSQDNGDDTSSLFVAQKHLLTFRNLHKNYDEYQWVKAETPQKSHLRLLPYPKKVTREITNVYLCEYCDADFTTQAEITAHERLCYGWSEPTEEPKPSTPSDLLGYLQLSPVGVKPLAKSKEPQPPKMFLIHNLKFGFSSDFGQSLLLNNCKKDLVGNSQKCVQQYELFCSANQRIGKSRESYELRALYKASAKKDQYEHCHQYSFSRRQRLNRYAKLKSERHLTLKLGLDSHSRELLSRMKQCSVRVRKCVPPPPPPEPMIIDLCSSDDDC